MSGNVEQNLRPPSGRLQSAQVRCFQQYPKTEETKMTYTAGSLCSIVLLVTISSVFGEYD